MYDFIYKDNILVATPHFFWSLLLFIRDFFQTTAIFNFFNSRHMYLYRLNWIMFTVKLIFQQIFSYAWESVKIYITSLQHITNKLKFRLRSFNGISYKSQSIKTYLDDDIFSGYCCCSDRNIIKINSIWRRALGLPLLEIDCIIWR